MGVKGELLPLGLCTDPKKCVNRCHYCLVRLYGEEYWLRKSNGVRKERGK